ncbi:MAG: hypothetical protein R6V42_11535 [Orrella sp.]
MAFAVLRAVAMALCAKWCCGDLAQTGLVADSITVEQMRMTATTIWGLFGSVRL